MNENDVIIDKENNIDNIEIRAKKQTKYLGQIINDKGVPTNR